jgi:hypothetical protein
VSFYGLLIAVTVATFFAVRYGRGWTKAWRHWMFDEPVDSIPPRRDRAIT